MTKLHKSLLVVIVVLSVALGSLFVQRSLRPQSSSVDLTVVGEGFYCNPDLDKSCAPKSKQVIYRTAAGESVTNLTLLDAPGSPTITQIRGGGRIASVYPEIGSYSSISTPKMSPEYLASRPSSLSADCIEAGSESKGTSSMLGYNVQQSETLNQDGRQEIWRAPALNCEVLRQEMYWSDPKLTVPSVYIARSVAIGTQPVTVFDPSTLGYNEKAPQELFHLLHLHRQMLLGSSPSAAEASYQSALQSGQYSQYDALQTAWLRQHPQ